MQWYGGGVVNVRCFDVKVAPYHKQSSNRVKEMMIVLVLPRQYGVVLHYVDMVRDNRCRGSVRAGAVVSRSPSVKSRLG